MRIAAKKHSTMPAHTRSFAASSVAATQCSPRDPQVRARTTPLDPRCGTPYFVTGTQRRRGHSSGPPRNAAHSPANERGRDQRASGGTARPHGRRTSIKGLRESHRDAIVERINPAAAVERKKHLCSQQSKCVAAGHRSVTATMTYALTRAERYFIPHVAARPTDTDT